MKINLIKAENVSLTPFWIFKILLELSEKRKRKNKRKQEKSNNNKQKYTLISIIIDFYYLKHIDSPYLSNLNIE